MGALRQPNLEPQKKAPAIESRKLDRFGRDPKSLPERLRARTDYKTGEGWAPLPHAALADLPRLASGAVCYAFILVVNMLSLGRPAPRGERHDSTEPISTADLAEYCRASERQIQREIKELEERGLIKTKTVKLAGTVKYVISLLYPDWRELEDYAVWRRAQVVAIDDASADVDEGDEEPAETSSEAVRLTRRPQSVRPGRASRAVKVSVGVKELTFQNDSPAVDASFSAVVQSGRLVVSATFQAGEIPAKSEDKANAERHPRRAVPNAGAAVGRSKGETHERAKEICALFDPLLSRWGSPLLALDEVALERACSKLGGMPADFLTHWILRPDGRGSRRISGALAVAAIVDEARKNWEAAENERAAREAADLPARLASEKRVRNDRRETALRILASTDTEFWKQEDRDFARDELNQLGREFE